MLVSEPVINVTRKEKVLKAGKLPKFYCEQSYYQSKKKTELNQKNLKKVKI